MNLKTIKAKSKNFFKDKFLPFFLHVMKKLFVNAERVDLIPRLKYSSVAGGWVLIGFNERKINLLVPSKTGFNLLTGRVRSFLLATFFVAVSISGAFAYSQYSKPSVLFDFLCYVLPSLAGVFGGMGIYYEGQAKKMFWLSAVCLGAGLYLYFDAHSQIKVIGFMVFVAAIIVIAALFFYVNNKMNKNGRGARERVVGTLISIILMTAALYLAHVTYGVLVGVKISPFLEKPPLDVSECNSENSNQKNRADKHEDIADPIFDFRYSSRSSFFHYSHPTFCNP